jgi:hypothetical protein
MIGADNMSKHRSSEEWLALIQDCRTSGYSDQDWCQQNNISLSSLYYNLKKLRKSSCEIIEPTRVKRQERQEVVQISVNDHQVQPSFLSDEKGLAIRINLNGVMMEIINGAAKDTIEYTLQALSRLC